MEVSIDDNVRLWAQDFGAADMPPLLLIAGANSPGRSWPGAFLATLARRHRVIRYDHRDTGRSTRGDDAAAYTIADLATDAVKVLDAFGIGRAHVVGMSMGGLITQLLLLDHPERLLTSTVFCCPALGDSPGLPGPDPRLVRLWEDMARPGDREERIEQRVEHRRLLNGRTLPFDAERFRRLEEFLAGRHADHSPHTRLSRSVRDRGAELAGVQVPTLVIEAPEDPVNPPPHARHLADRIPSAELTSIAGLGHVLHPRILTPLAAAILTHTFGHGPDPAPDIVDSS